MYATKKLNTNLSPSNQVEDWKNNENNIYAPFSDMYAKFSDEELEKATKNFIRKDTLPQIRQNFKNIGMNFDKDLSRDGKIGNMDLMYNLGPNKFKLGISAKEGYWPNYTNALLNQDFDEAAKQSHRRNIGENRNRIIHHLIQNGKNKF